MYILSHGHHRATLLALMVCALSLPRTGRAHEPLFGVGPHTLFKGGVAAEIEGEFAADTSSNVYELAYGITADLTVTAQFPLVYRSDVDTSRFGVGDTALRLKWRFLRLDAPGGSNAFAVVAGVKLPTGSAEGDLPLGTGTTDAIAALTYGHEGRRWYWWTDVRYLLTTGNAGADRGDVFFYDAAFGVRPWRLTYEQPDLVVLWEVNGKHIGPTREGGTTLADTVADVITTGPAILLSYRNIMFKTGLATPVWSSISGSQGDQRLEGVVALEGHF